MNNAWTASTQDKEWLSEADWLKRHDALLERTAKGGYDVLFIGDSITAAWLDAGKESWERAFVPLKAGNFGIGGDETQHLLWRGQNGELEGLSPKLIVLLIGTNNIANAGHSGADTLKGVETYINLLKEKLPQSKILVHLVFPRGEKKENPFMPQIDILNNGIAKLADDETVFLMDVRHLFVGEDGKVLPELLPDYLHLSPMGYALWTEALEPRVKGLLALQ